MRLAAGIFPGERKDWRLLHRLLSVPVRWRTVRWRKSRRTHAQNRRVARRARRARSLLDPAAAPVGGGGPPRSARGRAPTGCSAAATTPARRWSRSSRAPSTTRMARRGVRRGTWASCTRSASCGRRRASARTTTCYWPASLRRCRLRWRRVSARCPQQPLATSARLARGPAEPDGAGRVGEQRRARRRADARRLSGSRTRPCLKTSPPRRRRDVPRRATTRPRALRRAAWERHH